jgi:hypothetical protein
MPPSPLSPTRPALRFREIAFSFEPPVPGLSIDSLPGLARFGCDLSATIGGIPNFGRNPDADVGRRSDVATHPLVMIPATEFSVGTGSFHQSIQPFSPQSALDHAPRTIADCDNSSPTSG